MAFRFRLRRSASPAAANASTEPLLDGEMGWDTVNVKVGDGSSLWAALPGVNVADASGIPKHVGQADDLAAAIAALVAGDHLVVGAGTHPIASTLSPPSNSRIDFEHLAVIEVPAGCTFHAIDIAGRTNVTVNSPRVTKAAGAAAVGNVAGVRISGASTDVTVVGGNVVGLGRGFDIDGQGSTVQRVTLRDCISDDAVQYGVALADCDVVTLENVRSLGSGLDGIKCLKAANNVTLDGFYLTGAIGGDGLDGYAGGGRWKILNGTAEGNGLNGIVVKSSTLNATLAVTVTAVDDLITAADHVNTNDTAIVFSGLAGAAPLVNGTTYYIRDVTTNTFKVAATLGGAAINVTSDGTGTFRAAGYGLVESIELDNLHCIDNGGSGLTIHRDAGDSAVDHTAQPLPSHVLVGSVIAEGNTNHGVYIRANGVDISQVIANGNGLHGIEVDGASVDVTIQSWQASGNSQTTPNLSDGLHVEGGTRIRVGPGNARGAWVQGVRSDADIVAGTATQRYGLRIEAAVVSYMAHAPFGANNMTGLLSYPSTKGWMFPSMDFNVLQLPNGAQILISETGGTGRRAAFMSLTNVMEFGGTANLTIIRSSGQVLLPGELELDGALNHDGTTVGFYGATPVVKAASPGVAAGTDAAVLNAVITALRNLGLVT